MWNMVLDTLLHTIVVAYADDVLLLVEANSRGDLESISTVNVDRVSEWSNQVGVNVSVNKTFSMLLKGKLAESRRPIIKLQNMVSIKYVKEVEYLGVAIGERMNFLNYLTMLKKKLLPLAGAMRRITRKEWGRKKKATSTIYNGLLTACAL